MCGIVGYMGDRDATPVIMNGLKMLQYRGYDSAGICTMEYGAVDIRRSSGKLSNLERLLQLQPLYGTVGIGHTRWATHGKPSVTNAHPHRAGSVVLVHNGIIENYQMLKDELVRKGHWFESETDSEVISHLIDENLSAGLSFELAVQKTLLELEGAYALCVLSEKEENTMIVAKSGSPMIVGIKGREYFVASDMPAIIPNTREMVIMEDGEMAVIRNGKISFSTILGQELSKKTLHIDWSLAEAEKRGFPNYMLKEIHEQPQALRALIGDCLIKDEGDVLLEGLGLDDEALRSFDRLCLVACGSSWHAALIGKYLIEEQCRIPVDVEIASEFRYRNPIISETTLVIPISQSGETADTLAALREVKGRNRRVVSICNVIDSSIARESDGIIHTHAGLEIGVASTKAFTNQVVALYLLAIRLGRATGTISRNRGLEMIADLTELPDLVEKTLKLDFNAEEIACEHLTACDAIYLGRGICYPVALEGALKLKEISYVHADGYPAGEMKHGPIALIDRDMLVFVLAPRDRHLAKVRSNMEEVVTRGGRVIALCSEGDEETGKKAEFTLSIPWAGETLSPLLFNVALQLLAYNFAILKGKDVDQPRNLAKSVTVE
ncbi:glutamine--fructose-6-phosphate transaminase (isomerizing) [Trichlorobacter ammonificans]|uniref:Glutamine--fructose-6-phosphate aminotransferase [isomerizing] n=1 Tax=Trichlorobacter ammonificans TaxID=2916410 RepID=A0ABM9DAH5_9BACT|nr:glutamine--fructose-6-phosphate transaminase (isomerizing) [Trichlorobacter ammonificans]CAH2031370.1 Glutamine--fructose-6-phosphate aminotransferase [isomerizing] [Trichlorobacter ammonificans]